MLRYIGIAPAEATDFAASNDRSRDRELYVPERGQSAAQGKVSKRKAKKGVVVRPGRISPSQTASRTAVRRKRGQQREKKKEAASPAHLLVPSASHRPPLTFVHLPSSFTSPKHALRETQTSSPTLSAQLSTPLLASVRIQSPYTWRSNYPHFHNNRRFL